MNMSLFKYKLWRYISIYFLIEQEKYSLQSKPCDCIFSKDWASDSWEETKNTHVEAVLQSHCISLTSSVTMA